MLMRKFLLGLILLLPAPLPAQQGAGQQQEALRRQVMERFMENYRNQAALTDEQYDQFRQVMQRSFRERRQIEARQRQLLRALEGQLRPGVAADTDSLDVLLASISVARQELVDLAKADVEELAGFLDSVQQAQFVLSLERLQRQIENILRRRAQPARRPGTGNAGSP